MLLKALFLSSLARLLRILQYVLQTLYITFPMANHPSAVKRVRANAAKRLRNRYQHKTARTFLKKLLQSKTKAEAEGLYPQASRLLDKLAPKKCHPSEQSSTPKVATDTICTSTRELKS